MASLNVPFLSKAVLIERAATFLRENRLTEIPIDIEFVAEQKYRANIIPFSDLHREYGTDGFSSSDFSRIYVDEFVYYQRPTRLRFTVAHELGHRMLHRELLESLSFSSVNGWVGALDSIDSKDYASMEFQANAFASLVLMPQYHLEIGFRKQLDALAPQIREAEASRLTRKDYLDNVIDAIAGALSPEFDVSLEAMTLRIKNSEIDSWVP